MSFNGYRIMNSAEVGIYLQLKTVAFFTFASSPYIVPPSRFLCTAERFFLRVVVAGLVVEHPMFLVSEESKIKTCHSLTLLSTYRNKHFFDTSATGGIRFGLHRIHSGPHGGG